MKVERASPRRAGQSLTGSDPSARVLVAEGNGELRQALCAALRRRDLVVDEAGDGTSAIALVAERTYGVVLFDLQIEGVGAFEVAEAVDRFSASASVVLVLAANDPGAIEQLDSRRVHGVVRKPVVPDEIAELVAACAEIRGRSAFEAMAIATVLSGVPLLAMLSL